MIAAANIVDEMEQRTIQALSNEILQTTSGKLIEWRCDTLGSGARNFVTGGIFRVSGVTELNDTEHKSWSLVLKIVVADPTRTSPLHFNYWLREVEAYKSGMLQHLPANFIAPRCLAIDHREDGKVWLWLEDVGHGLQEWGKSNYVFACRKLGQFHAAYLLDEPLPSREWVNPKWMQSWIQECIVYRPKLDSEAIERLLADDRLSDIILKLNQLEDVAESWITALEQLPRVFSHQDYDEQNIMLQENQQEDDTFMLLDWQFASISGVGEDLGRFWGLAVSRGQVPIEQLETYRELFFSSYMQGLRHAGWRGDAALARFGFTASFAMRSIWEAPVLLKTLGQHAPTSASDKLLLIVELQLSSAMEAADLLDTILQSNT